MKPYAIVRGHSTITRTKSGRYRIIRPWDDTLYVKTLEEARQIVDTSIGYGR